MTKRAILLEALASTTPDLARLARSLDAEAEPAATTIFAELLRRERAFQEAIHRVVETPAPTAPLDNTVALASITEGLAGFTAERERTLTLLEPLSPKVWQQQLSDAADELTTLRHLAEDLVAHDIELTARLALLQAAHRQVPTADGGPAT